MIKKCFEEGYVEGYERKWYRYAREVLQHNRINSYVYAEAFRDLVTRGRGKFRNMIVGPANCGKTFMLKPLEHVYHAFCNPANDNYALVGADEAVVIVLLDFRWSPELICWKDLLLLLEGNL